jgi:anti-sigma regulatory factor (Ser/Thr protein kinase)
MKTPDPLLSVWQLTPGLTAAGEARAALRAWLSGLQVDPAEGVGADLIASASELAANAVVHGKPPVWLSARVELSPGCPPVLVISVTDAGGSALAPSAPDAESENGRGLAIVAALADWSETTVTWNATQVRAGFSAPGLSVPAQRPGGARAGLAPAAPLSALI